MVTAWWYAATKSCVWRRYDTLGGLGRPRAPYRSGIHLDLSSPVVGLAKRVCDIGAIRDDAQFDDPFTWTCHKLSDTYPIILAVSR